MRTTRLRGARTHNLQSVDLDLEPGSLVVIAGPSGAGKSSLAFGTLYAEGQRRYVESFSAYARQFLERLARPPVDSLDPVPAAIAVDRQAPVKTSRSTVGTMTELTDYTKALYARAAHLFCPSCGRKVERDAPVWAAKEILDRAPDQKVVITYPVAVSDPEQFLGVRESLLKDGYRRVRVGAQVQDLDAVRPSDILGEQEPTAPKKKKSKKSAPETPLAAKTLHVVADRAVARAGDRPRIVEALEQAMTRGDGRADVHVDGGETFRFSSGLHCAHCDRTFRDATPAIFSFNSPIGACEPCKGFGRVITIDWEKVIPNERLSLEQGVIRPWNSRATTWERKHLLKRAAEQGIPTDAPFSTLTKEQRAYVIEGDGGNWKRGWFGIRGWFEWLETRTYKMHVRVLLARYRTYVTCQACGGSRLKPEASWWKIGGKTLTEVHELPVGTAHEFLQTQETSLTADEATARVFRECMARLGTLRDVGLPYLTLDRPSRTLSGGEAQRVALTSALGASLTGAMFVLDEPTVGLHPDDVDQLFGVVRQLTTGGNIAVVVEHDLRVIEGADRVVELGPGAGEHGGTIVFDGPPKALTQADTATGRAFAPFKKPKKTTYRSLGSLSLRGARGNNLRGVDLTLPLGKLTVVTGPSGSGKSSLILETLVPAVSQKLLEIGLPSGETRARALEYASLSGFESLRGVSHVDQSPLGRTSRGNPATYMKIWDAIRTLFAKQPLAKERGYTAGFFSFNVVGGRCEACRGEGAETVEMQFLADVTFSCPECGGKRFVGPILEVKAYGLNVAEVLDLTIDAAHDLFEDQKEIRNRLDPLRQAGLGYLRLGQSLSTLSGGEAQRLKLAQSLSGTHEGSLIVLDEPTAGLHHQDITPLLAIFDRLVARGDTVVVIEHDMRVAAYADHVIDLGPGAGDQGGEIIAFGTPEEVAKSQSRTAPHLAEALGLKKTKKPLNSAKKPAKPTNPESLEDLPDLIRVRGATEHNLKHIDIDIPRDQLVVVTGPSGSGKSTLAFDVIHAEAQRRYLETLSAYARQYMPQLPRPHVDKVIGLPPSVSLEQRVTRSGSMSTVATTTEVAHYLRLLWARAGLLHCPYCNVPIAPRQPNVLSEDVRKRHGKSTEITLLAPVVRAKKGHHGPVFLRAVKDGFKEARIDGQFTEITRTLRLERFVEHDIDLVIAKIKPGDPAFEDKMRETLLRGEGTARVISPKGEELLSSKRACASCGRGFPELDPRFFSFHTKQGQCESCEGRGVLITTVGRGPNAREEHTPCTTCDGTRLSKLARSVTFQSDSIDKVLALSVTDARKAVRNWKVTGRDAEVAKVPIQELSARLTFLEEVGLGYLGLDRAADTLSGGETQRVRLAAQLGSGLTGLLYVLDEPTIGLHPRDTGLLLRALRNLVDKGCSVLVVEHDAETIRAADHLIDVGPTGGIGGGHIVAQGPAEQVLNDPKSVTGKALSHEEPRRERKPVKKAKDVQWLKLTGASEHNLKNVDLSIPLGRFVTITGVSGSGKSTLIRDVLLRAVRQQLDLQTDPPGAFRKLTGTDPIKRAIEIDQSPIGRTPRSVPATYVGIWDELRRLLAATPEARARGYGPSRFSFNVAEGRCPACEGQGALAVEMSFLPDVLVPCEACGGKRFVPETLLAKLNGCDAAALLDLDVATAVEVLSAYPKVVRPLRLLRDLGLGYLKLGQPSNTLSGGEAQRMKLTAELAASGVGPTLYVLDEPTTGLHRDDVSRLLKLLDALVERGDTVVLIEHHTDVMWSSDWIVDLGPEGGAGGGEIVCEGTPEDVAGDGVSRTGAVLRGEKICRS